MAYAAQPSTLEQLRDLCKRRSCRHIIQANRVRRPSRPSCRKTPLLLPVLLLSCRRRLRRVLRMLLLPAAAAPQACFCCCLVHRWQRGCYCAIICLVNLISPIFDVLLLPYWAVHVRLLTTCCLLGANLLIACGLKPAASNLILCLCLSSLGIHRTPVKMSETTLKPDVDPRGRRLRALPARGPQRQTGFDSK